jgi:hypothetical protein
MSIRVNTTAIVCLLLGFVNAYPAQDAATSKNPKINAAFEILHQAVIDATRDKPKVQTDNLESLKRLQNVQWPHVSELPWFHVYLNDAKEGQYTGVWKVEENETDVTLLTAGLSRQTLKKSRVKEMRPALFRDDIKALLQYCMDKKEEDKRKWDFTYIEDFDRSDYPIYGGVFLLRYAYVAADYGMKEETAALVAEVFKRVPEGFSNLLNELVWQELMPAMSAFQGGSSRRAFLETCKRLRRDYPGSRYDKELDSLIVPLERELSTPKPSFMEKDIKELTSEERIQYWIYQLRDLAGHQWSDPGYPDLFYMDGVRPTPADQIVAIGTPAIPYLIKTLEDDTPTRTIAWQRSFYPIRFVLRRQDVAIKCLERIVGCDFYAEAATYMHFYMDTEERKHSVIANINKWWAESKDTSQAVMVRNQLKLMDKNITLRKYERIDTLEVLAMLEGPESIVEEGATLLAEEKDWVAGPVRDMLSQVDPRTPVRQAFDCFWQKEGEGAALAIVLQYGDKKVYTELARRFEIKGDLGGDSWNAPDQIRWVARYGLNWAIPIVATAMDAKKLTMKYKNDVNFVAVEKLQELTGMDFGYNREKNEQDKKVALERALAWWENEGKTSMAEKITEDHPPVDDPGDLLFDDEALQKQVAAIQNEDNQNRGSSIAALGEVRTYQTQQALFEALRKEQLAQERVKIIAIIGQRPKLWHLPMLFRLLSGENNLAVRIQAGSLIQKIVGNKSISIWSKRLETRDTALEIARQLAKDKDEPRSIREVATSILLAWNSFVDQNLLRELAADTELAHYEPLRSHIENTDKRLREMPMQITPKD